MSIQAFHIASSACDRELLTSGMLSDIKVECGDKSWALHRIILTTRCPFFKAAPMDNGVIKIDNQNSKGVDWAIHFIYTGQLPSDIMKLLDNKTTVMRACIELYTVANFFTLDGLRQRAVEVLTENLIWEAASIQDVARIHEVESIKLYVDRFSSYFLETVRTVYNGPHSTDLEPLKDTLMLYIKLTRHVVLRKEFLGEKLRTDKGLTGFLNDILEATLFRSYLKWEEYMESTCFKCEESMTYAVEFGDVFIGDAQKAWCRKCKPLGEENVLELLGHTGKPLLKNWR